MDQAARDKDLESFFVPGPHSNDSRWCAWQPEVKRDDENVRVPPDRRNSRV